MPARTPSAGWLTRIAVAASSPRVQHPQTRVSRLPGAAPVPRRRTPSLHRPRLKPSRRGLASASRAAGGFGAPSSRACRTTPGENEKHEHRGTRRREGGAPRARTHLPSRSVRLPSRHLRGDGRSGLLAGRGQRPCPLPAITSSRRSSSATHRRTKTPGRSPTSTCARWLTTCSSRRTSSTVRGPQHAQRGLDSALFDAIETIVVQIDARGGAIVFARAARDRCR